MKVREILVHRPGTELKIVNKPSRWLFDGYISIMEMQREHDELIKILNSEGVKTHYLQKATSFKPKLYLTRDSAIVLDKKAVTSHYIHSIRRGEEQVQGSLRLYADCQLRFARLAALQLLLVTA